MLTIGDVVEEIALEGSDGITVECLFERLNRTRTESDEHAPKDLDRDVSLQIWRAIVRDREITFYELENERFLPQFPVRQSSSGSDQLHEASAPDEKDVERDPYRVPRAPFNREVTTEVRQSVEAGQESTPAYYNGPGSSLEGPIPHARLVILASERQRYAALKKGTTLTYSHLDKLDVKSFYLIEKLARSRHAGCLQSTLNKINLSKVEDSADLEDPDQGGRQSNSHVQYLISPLEKAGLVTKQQYAYRFQGRPRHQVLVMLTRFQRDFRTRHKILSEKIIDILRSTPGYIMSMTEVKHQLASHIGVQRLNDDLFKKVYQNLKNR